MLKSEKQEAFEILNPVIGSEILLVCEHASNRVPVTYGELGLSRRVLNSHAAWDIGAGSVARAMSRILNAPLVQSTVSRLVVDCNRDPNSPDAMPTRVEIFEIPGNNQISAEEQEFRLTNVYEPFHDAVARTLVRMSDIRAFVTLHSFTPVFFGVDRRVDLGILYDGDGSLSEKVYRLAEQSMNLRIAFNEPYKPESRVTHTVRRHAIPRGVPHVMLEIRNSLVRTKTDQINMAEQLSTVVRLAL